MSKRTIVMLKILALIIVIGIVGIGAWQFNKSYTISKKINVNQMNKDIENLKHQAETQQAEITNLKALNDMYYDSWVKDVPKATTTTTPTQPKYTNCSWIGNTWSCTTY